jgi:hypothetical protein
LYPYRVFVSYAHEDIAIAREVAGHFSGLGLINMWDQAIVPGQPFTEEIKKSISRSHLFVPLITPVSIRKPWVHQETGYAMGMGVPLLPVAIGELPGQMIEQLQALSVGADIPNLGEAVIDVLAPETAARLAADLTVKLTGELIESRVLSSRISTPSFSTIDHPERRTELIVEYTREVRELIRHLPDGQAGGSHLRLRHSGAFSSFSLPDEPPDDPVWYEHGGLVPGSGYYYELLWEERKALEQYARAWGCDLLIDPAVGLKGDDIPARRVRLGILVDFLRRSEDDRLRVMIKGMNEPGNVIIVGDWFYAESLAPKKGAGYRQTNFTWHAPTVLRRIRRFAERFDRFAAEQAKEGVSSRTAAIEKIGKIIESIS